MNLQTGFTIFINHNLKGSQYLQNFPASYWQDIRQLSYQYYNKDDYKKEHTVYIQKKKNLAVLKKKTLF